MSTTHTGDVPDPTDQVHSTSFSKVDTRRQFLPSLPPHASYFHVSRLVWWLLAYCVRERSTNYCFLSKNATQRAWRFTSTRVRSCITRQNKTNAVLRIALFCSRFTELSLFQRTKIGAKLEYFIFFSGFQPSAGLSKLMAAFQLSRKYA